MTNPVLHASRNAGSGRRDALEIAGLAAAAAVFLAFTDAFGLDVLPLGARILYWLVLVGFGQILGALIWPLSERLLPAARPLLIAALNCLVLSVPCTVVVWLATSLVLSQPLRPERLPGFVLPVLVVAAAIAGLNTVLNRKPIETHEDVARAPAGRAPIFARFPPKLRPAALHAIEAEDHYIRLHTSAGSDLVLLRFSDALAELEGIEGAQVHRSWWVAKDAVTATARDGGKLLLVLRDGTKAPVSRSFVRALRAKGWF
jgi:LytTr DNA-binding domain